MKIISSLEQETGFYESIDRIGGLKNAFDQSGELPLLLSLQAASAQEMGVLPFEFDL